MPVGPRIYIGKQTELSAVPFSTVRTDAANEQEYVAPGAVGTVLTIDGAGIPNWAAGGGDSLFYWPYLRIPTRSGAAPLAYLDGGRNDCQRDRPCHVCPISGAGRGYFPRYEKQHYRHAERR